MKRILIAIAALVVGAAYGQEKMPNSMTVLKGTNLPIEAIADGINFTPLDKATFKVLYNQTYGKLSERMALYIGSKTARFVAMKLSVGDYEKYSDGRAMAGWVDAVYGCEVITTIPSRNMEVINHIPFVSGSQCVTYTEPAIQLNWALTGDKESISGYECYKATTNFGGRKWNAWFTPELPYQLGPWKLSGLPGLILKAQDSQGNYTFTAVGIEKSTLPINRYKYSEKKSTKADWAKMEADIYASPYQYSGATDDDWFYAPGKDGKSTRLTPDNWSVDYNPIEK